MHQSKVEGLKQKLVPISSLKGFHIPLAKAYGSICASQQCQLCIMPGRPLKKDSDDKLNLAASVKDPLLEVINLGSPTPIASIVNEPGIDFLKDDPSEMTFGRRIARGLMNKKWYNPRAGQPEPPKRNYAAAETDPKITDIHQPSLNKAWAYFEHVAMSRHFIEPKEKETTNIYLRILHKFSKGDKKMELAGPGEAESPTRLYDPIFTPHSQVSATDSRCRFGFFRSLSTFWFPSHCFHMNLMLM